MIIEYIYARINSAAHITRQNINSRNVFIKKKHQNDDANFVRKFTKRLIFNISKNR